VDPTRPDVSGPLVTTGPPLDVTGTLPNVTPSYDISKICEPLVFGPGAQTAEARCEITITTQNLPPNQIVKLTDGLSYPSGTNAVPFQGPFMNLQTPNLIWACTGSTSPAALGICYEQTDSLIAQGGTIVATWWAEIVRDDVHQHRGLQNCAHLEIGNGPRVSSCAPLEVAYQKGAQTSTDQTPATTTASFLDPVLKTRKQQTSECVVNRNTQRYTCGFRITVTNEGNVPFNGPLVVTDTFGSPWAQAITQTSGGGWSCAQPVSGAVSCEHSGLNLPQGSFAYIDLDMQVQGLVNGGVWENCAATGIPNDRKQRVAAIQQVMNARGFAAGPVDGLPGAKTYRALAELQKSLGLPVSRDFDDALFHALGLPLAKPGEKACVTADLPPMPKPPLVCERATAIKKGEACVCRYDNMVKRNATACSCKGGYSFVAGKGCVIKAKPAPSLPSELEETLTCDKRTTRLRGDQCVCIDQENAVKTSQTTCGCKNGGPMIGGRCLSISITPGGGKPSDTDGAVGTQDTPRCKIVLNGICIK